MRDGEIVSTCFAKRCRWRNGLQKNAKSHLQGPWERTFYNSALMQALHYTRAQQLPAILAQRIVILDGAMGTMIQRFKLGEAQYRGEGYTGQTEQVTGSRTFPAM